MAGVDVVARPGRPVLQAHSGVVKGEDVLVAVLAALFDAREPKAAPLLLVNVERRIGVAHAGLLVELDAEELVGDPLAAVALGGRVAQPLRQQGRLEVRGSCDLELAHAVGQVHVLPDVGEEGVDVAGALGQADAANDGG